MSVDGARGFTVASRRNDGLDAGLFNDLNQGISVVPLVGNDCSRIKMRDQCRALRHIGHRPYGQAQCIHASVNLGSQSATTSPDGLVLLRTVFFRATAAC